MFSPLTADEQRVIASRFTALQSAIERGSPLPRKYEALCKLYRGKSRGFLHSFASTRDKRHWAWQLEMYLFAEIDPEYWPTKGH